MLKEKDYFSAIGLNLFFMARQQTHGDGNTATCCMGVYGVKTVRFKPQKLFISYI